MIVDAFTREIIKDSFTAVGDEMFQALIRTAMNPIIYESTDFAVGATDAVGNLLAQGNGLTAFLASLDAAVRSNLEHHPAATIRDGDIYITNCPYEGGGTHLSDVSILYPVFAEGTLIAWTAVKAHWTEVGGMQAGSSTTSSTEIFQEGLHFRFLKLCDRGAMSEPLLELIRANVRLPDATMGDLHACIAACRVGARRIAELADKYGSGNLLHAMVDLLDYGERMTREELKRLPHEVFTAEDVIEEDGRGGGLYTVKVKLTIDADGIVADFSGTSPQAVGLINLGYPGLVAAARCAFKAMTDPDIAANGGCFRPLQVVCPPGTIVSAISPAPVSIYYEAMQTAIEVMWMALAPLLPERLPAGHFRTVGGTFIAGPMPETGKLFVIGQALLGGWGAASDCDGQNGQFCGGTGDITNIPIEVTESRYGLEVDQYAFHDEDGGGGQYRGGKGVVLDYRVTAPAAFLTHAATRTKSRPWALNGGLEGSLNRAAILRNDGTVQTFTMVSGERAERGEVIQLITATGGGNGDPARRDPEALKRDVRDGFVTKEQARRDYGRTFFAEE